MEIPVEELSADILNAIIEEYVTREGTDYGEQEFSLNQKVEQIRAQIDRGEVKIWFDPDSETCQLVANDTSQGWNNSGSRTDG